jgi:hypothetical protein
VHGWIYDLHDGLLRDLGVRISAAADLQDFATVARAEGELGVAGGR